MGDLVEYPFRAEVWGTAAAWLTGTATVLVAVLALVQARRATYWAKRAALAEERNVHIAETSQPVDIELAISQRSESDTQAALIVTMKLSPDSTLIWLRDVEILAQYWAGGVGLDTTKKWFDDLADTFGDLSKMVEPLSLSPGQEMTRSWAVAKYNGDSILTKPSYEWGAHANVLFSFSADDGAPVHTRRYNVSQPFTTPFPHSSHR